MAFQNGRQNSLSGSWEQNWSGKSPRSTSKIVLISINGEIRSRYKIAHHIKLSSVLSALLVQNKKCIRIALWVDSLKQNVCTVKFSGKLLTLLVMLVSL